MAANAKRVATGTDEADEALKRGELDDMIGIALIRAHNGAYKYFYKSMDKDMKPGFYTSLSLIQQNPGLTQTALARAIQRDPSTIVPILDTFEKRNWIERRRSETDRRAHALYLTPAGKAAARRFDKKVGDIEAKIQAHFGEKNSRELKALLKQLESFFTEHTT